MTKGFISVLLLLVAAALFYQSDTFQNLLNTETYIETNIEFYKVSSQCLSDYYSDELTEDGYIFTFNPPNNDCDAELVLKHKFIIKSTNTISDDKILLKNIMKLFKESRADLYLTRSVLLKNQDGVLLEDMTETIKNEHEKERNNEYDPETPSLLIEPGNLQNANFRFHDSIRYTEPS
jgi:hypothetical protein